MTAGFSQWPGTAPRMLPTAAPMPVRMLPPRGQPTPRQRIARCDPVASQRSHGAGARRPGHPGPPERRWWPAGAGFPAPVWPAAACATRNGVKAVSPGSPGW